MADRQEEQVSRGEAGTAPQTNSSFRRERDRAAVPPTDVLNLGGVLHSA